MILQVLMKNIRWVEILQSSKQLHFKHEDKFQLEVYQVCPKCWKYSLKIPWENIYKKRRLWYRGLDQSLVNVSSNLITWAWSVSCNSLICFPVHRRTHYTVGSPTNWLDGHIFRIDLKQGWLHCVVMFPFGSHPIWRLHQGCHFQACRIQGSRTMNRGLWSTISANRIWCK